MKPSTIALIVHFQIKPNCIPEAIALFKKHESDSRKDAGNLEFNVFQDREDPSRFSSYETWEDEASIEAHDATDVHATFISTLKTIQSSEKTVQKLQTITAV